MNLELNIKLMYRLTNLKSIDFVLLLSLPAYFIYTCTRTEDLAFLLCVILNVFHTKN
jgi:hypothetical protein